MKPTYNYGIEIGEKLRKLRNQKGYSQEYIADVLCVSQKTYSNMENNKSSITIDVVKKLAQEYEIEMAELLKDDRVVIQNNNSHDSSTFNGIFNNNLSEELLNHLKERITDLKEIITQKEAEINRLRDK